VSPGTDASACGLKAGGVLCWGEGYSKPNAQDVPIEILFEPVVLPLAPQRDVAVVGARDPNAFAESCQIQRGCSITPIEIAHCGGGVHAFDWSELARKAPTLVGHDVSVRGPLGVGSLSSTAIGCWNAADGKTPNGLHCCNATHADVLLGGDPGLKLADFFCNGDDSEACCNVAAYGQTVVASGRLERDGVGPNDSRFELVGSTLCDE
jgi:hypothetical protein